MVTEQFTEQLEAYSRWKKEISRQIDTYRKWLEQHDMSSPEDDLRLFETIEALKTDQVTIAVAAEFSRGKTELINAIFFADYERRLLPSSAGRTTMCPTELFYDEDESQPYIRLLPIETRLEDLSIAEYKQNREYWTRIELDPDNPEALVESFQEIVRTKQVAVDKAIKLGLYSEDQHSHKEAAPETVEIPMWRHVLISFPHPLLKQGLVILDTPGLNALGSEPELTMDMLPRAQAVIFLLAADTGATKSDMEIWQQHAKTYRDNQQTGVIVVLNKIDTLWDELQDDTKVVDNIDEQCRDTADMLGIDRKDVYPVSAQKGLLAKVRKDEALLQRSGLLTLEGTLSEDILPKKQEIVRDNLVGKIGSMVKTTKSILSDRYENNQEQLRELREMSGKNADVLMESMKKLRAEQSVYQKDVENFQTSRQVLKRQLIALSEAISLEALDRLIGKTREVMVDSWTTGGMKKGMKTFFEGAQEAMTQVNWQVEKANKIVGSIYERFREEHGFTDVKPEFFSTAKYTRELKQLYEKAEDFRNSPVTTMTEQSFVVKKFFVNMVSHARNIFFKTNEDAERWSKSAMSPLGRRIKERKRQLEERLATMQKVKESREQLGENIKRLETECDELQQQLKTINSILDGINAPLPAKSEASEAPKIQAVPDSNSNIATG
jgi:predicted nuclease with TOPRIM domain